jgi:tetratricopeptide (TPR) repeat protein
MRLRTFLCGGGLGLMLATGALASGPDFQGIDRARLREIIAGCYNLSDDTPAQLAQLKREHPESLVPEVVRVVREYWWQSYAEADHALTAAYERDAQELVEQTGRAAREHPDDPDAAFLAALSQLHVGLYNVEKRHWWTAFWKIRAGRNGMLRLLQDHPDYVDAKMPLGLADCYLDQTPGYLKPLTLLLQANGDLNRGVRQLEEARDHGLFTAVDAAFYLSGVDFELRHQPEAARAEMAALAERFPANPFYQRLLAYYETQTGRRARGHQRYADIPDMPKARVFPAMGVRSLMWLCWDSMGTKDYAGALRAGERAAGIIAAHPPLRDLEPETLIGRAEAQKALGHYEESFALFNAISPDYPQLRQHGQDRIRDIKREIGRKE